MPEPGEQCPACGRRVRGGTQFCPGCGHTLVATSGSDPSPVAARTPQGKRFAQHWEELKRVFWVFGLLLASSFVFGIASRAARMPWMDVAEAAVDATIVLVALALRFRKLAFLFQLRPIALRESAVMVGISFLFVVLASAYFWTIEHAGVPMGSTTGALREAGWPTWAIFLIVSVTPAIIEELAFRGVIQSSLERVFNARDAWLIQAALFSVLHLSPLVFPSHFLMGLCFGYMRRRSRSIYPGMLLHACWNALVVLQELTA